ncbi:hypothetical protein O5476_07110 [Escherichia coli]|nr:hypothetical protein [Escherichia coli]
MNGFVIDEDSIQALPPRHRGDDVDNDDLMIITSLNEGLVISRILDISGQPFDLTMKCRPAAMSWQWS